MTTLKEVLRGLEDQVDRYVFDSIKDLAKDCDSGSINIRLNDDGSWGGYVYLAEEDFGEPPICFDIDPKQILEQALEDNLGYGQHIYDEEQRKFVVAYRDLLLNIVKRCEDLLENPTCPPSHLTSLRSGSSDS